MMIQFMLAVVVIEVEIEKVVKLEADSHVVVIDLLGFMAQNSRTGTVGSRCVSTGMPRRRSR